MSLAALGTHNELSSPSFSIRPLAGGCGDYRVKFSNADFMRFIKLGSLQAFTSTFQSSGGLPPSSIDENTAYASVFEPRVRSVSSSFTQAKMMIFGPEFVSKKNSKSAVAKFIPKPMFVFVAKRFPLAVSRVGGVLRYSFENNLIQCFQDLGVWALTISLWFFDFLGSNSCRQLL